MQNDQLEIRLPAEWEPQSAVQLTWPHEHTDWAYMLDEVIPVFADIAAEISKREGVVIVAHDAAIVRSQLRKDTIMENVCIVEEESNDTWARDHGGITVLINEIPYVVDFCFNGWGMKFAANKDNCITRRLYHHHQIFAPNVGYLSQLHCVLEGGSIESDGRGTILTTSECLLSENRNEHKSPAEIEEYLLSIFGAKQMHWLNNGYLEGDDTDSHIDTLARICPNNTILYVQCKDEEDEHFYDLKLMEDELKKLRTQDGLPYQLFPLPMPTAIYDEDGERLPATYANFLIINGAVLLPTYGQEENDALAIDQLKKVFPDREIIPIYSIPLIQQHGSLHCVTMQYPKGTIQISTI
jgi:agmatine/peptidylarginine deiminase